MNTTEIKTGWDLKIALETIISVLDEAGKLFSPLEADMDHAVGHFAANLGKMRDRMKSEMEQHRAKVEQIANDEYDALRAIRNRIADFRVVTDNLPSHYQLGEIGKLAEAARQIASIDETSWVRLERIIEASRKPVTTEKP